LHLGLRELLFDLRNRTNTSIETPHGPPAPSDDRPRHEPANPLVFGELLRRTPVDPRASAFLDLGAGKGRALILAAQHGFRKVVGVERSPRLCRIAEANVARYRARHPGSAIEVDRADAATVQVPADIDVMFLFDPFGADVLAAVIDGICESIRRAPRELHVVYMNPRDVHLFAEAGFTPVYRQGMDGVILRRRAACDS